MSIRDTMMVNSNFCLPLDELIFGRQSGFGDGHHGMIVYDGFFPAARANPNDKYEIHSTYFELPSGATLRPPLESTGLVIYSLSDIVINGTIDMKNRGFYYSNPGLPHTVKVYDRTFNLPLCGSTVASAMCGRGGQLTAPGYSPSNNGGPKEAGETSRSHGCYFSGGYSMPCYATGAHYNPSTGKWPDGIATILNTELRRQPTGIVLLIARGKITIRGKIDCSASPGIAAQPGEQGYLDGNKRVGGNSGAGAQSPSGGGGITLIAKEIERSGGILDVTGKSYINTTVGTDLSGSYTTFSAAGNVSSPFRAYGGQGGDGTSASGLISQAGNIKEYIYTSQGV